MLTPEQLLAAYGSHLVERAYILSLRRRCAETFAALEDTTDLAPTGEDRNWLEEHYTDLSIALKAVTDLRKSQEYLTQE